MGKAEARRRGGSQLKPTTMATTVRVRDGKRVITDGPFAETKEQLAFWTRRRLTG